MYRKGTAICLNAEAQIWQLDHQATVDHIGQIYVLQQLQEESAFHRAFGVLKLRRDVTITDII